MWRSRPSAGGALFRKPIEEGGCGHWWRVGLGCFDFVKRTLHFVKRRLHLRVLPKVVWPRSELVSIQPRFCEAGDACLSPPPISIMEVPDTPTDHPFPAIAADRAPNFR